MQRTAARLLKSSGLLRAPTPEGPHRLALRSLGRSVTDVVLLTVRGGVRLANDVAAEFPSATVHLLTTHTGTASAQLRSNVLVRACPTVGARLRYLGRTAQPQLIIDRGLERTGDRVESFRALFGLVAADGRYVVASVPPIGASPAQLAESSRLAGFLADLSAIGEQGSRGVDAYTDELSASIASIDAVPGGWVIAKRLAHQWKLRDRRANSVLTARFGTTWGEVITSKPALAYDSRARAEAHGDGLRILKPVIKVPERWLRRYQGVTCYARKRVRMGDYWLPDTFRNPQMRVLGHRALRSVSPTMARLPLDTEPAVRAVDGAFYYLDSEYFSHFGHVLTDVVSNTWGWELARRQVPGIRPLLSLPENQPEVPEFQRRIFAALDIDAETIEYVRPGSGLRVDELYSCTADWAIPGYAAPELGEVWSRICQSCMTNDPPSTLDRIFVSRRPRRIRTCLNAGEVERLFADLGFTVIYPETLGFGEQIAIFHRAKIIAGFAGSGMFNAMFSRGSTVLVLTGASYTALNEYLIKSVIGGDIHYFWTPSEIRHPPGGWTWEAFRSNFVFDIGRFRPEIEDAVARAAE